MGVLDRFKLDGKTALVTGCRRGIGRAFAVGLAEAGADIVGVSASLEKDSDVGKDIVKRGKSFVGYACDFSNREGLHDFIDQVNQDVGQIDILVNNAGTIMRAPAEVHSDEYWDKVLEVNLSAQFVLARSFGSKMLERETGKIIFTASVLTFQGGITVPGYAAAKGGIGQLTMALANEWAGRGVNVNAIAPGYIATDNNKALREDEKRNEQLTIRIPAGRWGTPEDLQGALIWLSSSASDYVHGSIVVVDGGWLGR